MMQSSSSSSLFNPTTNNSATLEAAKLRLLTAQKWLDTSTSILQNAQDQVNVATKELNDALNYLKLMERQQQMKEIDGKEGGGENGIKMEEEVGRNSTVHNVNIQKKPQHHVDSDRNMILSNSLSGETENETVDSSSDSFFGEGIVRKMNSVESDSSSPTSSQSRSSTTNNNNKEEQT